MMSRQPTLAASYGASLVAVCLLCAAGLVLLGAAWWGLSVSAPVPTQVSYIVSGVFTGMAVLGFGAGVLVVQDRRRAEARERAEFERVVAATEALVVTVRKQTAAIKGTS